MHQSSHEAKLNAGKHTNQCQARENMQPVIVKRAKLEDKQLFPNAGKCVFFAERRKIDVIQVGIHLVLLLIG